MKQRAPTDAPDLNSNRLLTIREFAIILNVSERHVENLLAKGLIKKVPGLGRSVRISPVEGRRFFNAEVA
jgi:excisionase family DNA binding protein